MLQDLQYACRSILRARGFAATAVLTLAVGIAANTIVYSIVNAMILRPLPFGDRGDRLVTLHSTHPTQSQDWDDAELSYPDLLDLRERARTLEDVQGVFTRNVALATAAEAERVTGASITPGLFSLLGVAPQFGRDFVEDDGREAGQEEVVIISHRLWERLFEADPSAVGTGIAVNARTLTVVGVMPPQFAFPENQDVWLPYRTSRDQLRERRFLIAVGLLRGETTLTASRRELSGIAAALADAHPTTNRDWGVHVMPLRDLFVTDSTRRSLTAMLGAVAFVLLVACANVGGLLVARGIGRRQELSIRTALGASARRIARLLLAESVLLAAVGGALGLLAASWGLDVLLASMAEPPVYWARPEIDARVLLFTTIITAATALLCGLLPAVRSASARALAGALHGGRGSSGTPEQRRLQGLLVAGQVALSFALLVAATLLAKSASTLQHTDIGFDGSPLLSMRVYIAGDAYDDPVARAAVLDEMVERLGAVPGAAAAAATGAIPGDDGGDTVRILPPRGPAVPGEEIGVHMVPITAGFFAALGLPLAEGRSFDTAEMRRTDGNAIVVSRRLARELWPGESAIGRDIRAAGRQGAVSLRVVGVAPDMVYEELGEETPQSERIVYVPYVRAGWRTMALLVRAEASPAPLVATAREAVRSVDRTFAPYDVLTMADRRKATSWGERFLGRTFSAFALVGLLLACVGTFGLTAQAAAQRRREIGVRMAIGARRLDILRLLAGRGAQLALLGGAAGLPLAIGAAIVVEGMLFRVSAWSPGVWVTLPVLLIGSVILASAVPAHAASRLDPASALRQE